MDFRQFELEKPIPLKGLLSLLPFKSIYESVLDPPAVTCFHNPASPSGQPGSQFHSPAEELVLEVSVTPSDFVFEVFPSDLALFPRSSTDFAPDLDA